MNTRRHATCFGSVDSNAEATVHLIEFTRIDPVPFFEGVHDRRRMLEQAARLGARGDIDVLGWRMQGPRIVLLVEGPSASLPQWKRLFQSTYGVNAHHWKRPQVLWFPATQVPVEDPDFALRILYTPRTPWCSAWECLGLRDWGTQPSALGIPPREHARHAGLSTTPGPDHSRPRMHPHTVLSRALVMATGRSASARQNSVAFIQLAFRAGWAPQGIALSRGLTLDSVRKALIKPLRPAVPAAAAWLRPPLRALLDVAMRPPSAQPSSVSAWPLP